MTSFRPEQEPGSAIIQDYVSFDPSKKASEAQNYFREEHYDGNTTQFVHRGIRNHEVWVKPLWLSQQQKTDFLSTFLRAQLVKFSSNRGNMSFSQLASVMADEYDSDALRLAVQSELEVLTIETFMADRKITDEATGITQPVEHMNILTPQCPPSFRSNSNKIRHLRHEVLAQLSC